jgi:hypothetical protein
VKTTAEKGIQNILFRTEAPLVEELVLTELLPLSESISSRLMLFSDKLLHITPGAYDVMGVFGDWQDDNGRILSVFDAFGSEGHAFVIRFHANRLLQIQEEDIDQFEHVLDQCVLHELVHALDMSVIRESCGIYHSRNSLEKCSDREPGLFWGVMHYFSYLRNEGVAMLAERLFLRNTSASSISIDGFSHELQKLFFHLEEQLETDSLIISGSFIRELCSSVYAFAADAMLDMLGLHNRSLPEKEDEKVGLLEKAMALDLSEWVILIFSRHREVLAKHEKALSVLMSAEEGSSRLLFMSLQFHFDATELIRYCTTYCERQMTLKELEEQVGRECLSDYDVELRLHLKAGELLQVRNEENAELIDWVLSYFYFQSDGITDDRPFIGYMDDWYVLDIALHRVGLKQLSIG